MSPREKPLDCHLVAGFEKISGLVNVAGIVRHRRDDPFVGHHFPARQNPDRAHETDDGVLAEVA
jgi:hypothetical protein